MTALVFGIGIGLFVILLLWTTAALVFAVSLRSEKRLGAIVAPAVAVLVTIILVGAPRAASREPEEPVVHSCRVAQDKQPYDRIFVPRVILLVSLVISSAVGLLARLRYQLLEGAEPRRVDDWIHGAESRASLRRLQ